MKRILFVDDEPMILAGLRNVLRRRRHEWDMVFVDGGEPALSALDTQTFDVIVSDMRMPNMDGATLLQHVQRLHPRTARIVLSGHMEVEMAMRAIPVAHQFLTKPCDADALKSALERTLAVQALLGNESLRALVGGIGELPSTPKVVAELTKALDTPSYCPDDVASLLECDLAMCAKVLQLVNSSFLGLGRRISSMRQSVSYLGATTLRRLIHSPEVFRTFGNASEVHGFSLDGLRNHSLVTARLAQHIVESSPEARAQSATTDSCGQSAERSTLAEDAFAAGMLHDVGLLVLAAHEPERLALALDHAKRNGGPISVAETTFFGATHAETGACLLGLWGLPCSVVQAVANHHHPTRAPNANSILVDAVHIANVLATEACHWLESDLDARIPDPASIDRIGSPALLAEWQQIAARLVRKVSASPVPECA